MHGEKKADPTHIKVIFKMRKWVNRVLDIQCQIYSAWMLYLYCIIYITYIMNFCSIKVFYHSGLACVVIMDSAGFKPLSVVDEFHSQILHFVKYANTVKYSNI